MNQLAYEVVAFTLQRNKMSAMLVNQNSNMFSLVSPSANFALPSRPLDYTEDPCISGGLTTQTQ